MYDLINNVGIILLVDSTYVFEKMFMVRGVEVVYKIQYIRKNVLNQKDNTES